MKVPQRVKVVWKQNDVRFDIIYTVSLKLFLVL